ncbi:MAG: DUF6514 family protein [Clostridiales bacterium]|nr:DUF6514 family protein [Clostridiales bacterium]
MPEQSRVMYQMIETHEYVEDSGMIAAYGVSCGAGATDAGRVRAKGHTIPNISTRSSFVEELVNRLNNHGAAPVHLRDLIEDYLP